ncbi:hypothetical protein GH714_043735 [Hevea brasiliensis]|uniref:TLC domain-containing protein n=1 Tax=Hevea brasiliensis TaxID=3981 RepID=A0A6A6K1A5_HEVBR|nr:hypothetical protein GH714_043735 [Hevea brasiliensis]
MESISSHIGSPNPWHFLVAVYFAVGFVAARFLLDKFVFRASPKTFLHVPMWILHLTVLLALLTWETRRKDFAVMMSHHVVTVILIGYSYITRLNYLALHDASDVLMEAAKVFKYSGRSLEQAFALDYCHLVAPTTTSILSILGNQDFMVSHHDLSKAYPLSLYYVFNTMLLMLLVFHIYWWVLIYSMIMKQLRNRGRVGEDIRSDSEDDD